MTIMKWFGTRMISFSYADGLDTAVSGSAGSSTGPLIPMMAGYASPADRDPQIVLDEFLRRFDRFTDLLCVAAREGMTPERAGIYVDQRAWFIRHYMIVLPFLRQSGMPGLGGAIANDAPPARDEMEALFLPPHIEQVIHCERVIGRLTSARHTVEICRRMFPSAA